MVEVSIPVADETLKKKAYHHGDLRNAIIQEATARARISGEKAIVLREIAPVIGVSATAAYRHFINRQQLVEEVAARGFTALGEYLTMPGVAGADADPGLAAYMDLRNAAIATVQFAVLEPAWTRMMIETLGVSDVVAASAAETFEIMQAIADRGIETGMFRPGIKVSKARILWATIDGLCASAMFSLEPMDTPEADHVTARALDLSMTDLLTAEGLRARDAVTMPDGIVTELPR